MYTSSKYSPALIVEAVKLIRSGMSFRKASRACGAPKSSIWRWCKTLDDDTFDLYACSIENTRKVNKVDLDNLPDDPDELKKIIFDMQFEMDLKEALVDILKKRPRRRPEEACEQGQSTSGGRLSEQENVFDWADAVIRRSRTSNFLLSQEKDEDKPKTNPKNKDK